MVLATGGLATGGIELDRDGLREPVLGLRSVAAVRRRPATPTPRPRENPVDRAGVAVDADMRPLDGDGTSSTQPARRRALLRGAVPWRELSGNGLALATGLAAADAILSERGGMTVDIRGSLDNCVKCTVCETFCPVAAATPLFPGPKYAGPQSERYRAPGESVDASLDYCSGCGICTQVCPQGVDIAEINARARAEMKAGAEGCRCATG